MAETSKNSLQANPTNETKVVTILQTTNNKLLTKRFHSGGCVQYDHVKFFTHEQTKIHRFDDLANLLRELEADPTRMVVAGHVKEKFKSADQIVRRSNTAKGVEATLEDSGSFLIHFDVDNLVFPLHLSWENPEAIAEWTWIQLCIRLPALMHVSVFWQASSSAGTPKKRHLAKFHFWVLADRPLKAHERKHLFATVGSDTQLASAAQPNYTAAPIFDGVPNPLVGLRRSGALRAAHDFLDTACIGFPSIPEKGKDRTIRSPSIDQSVFSSADLGNGNSTPKGNELLNNASARIRTKGANNTLIFNEAQLIGGHVANGNIAFEDAMLKLCAAAAETGYGRFAEVIDNGLRIGLERPLPTRAENAIAVEAFYPAPTIDRQRAIELHAGTISDWGARAKFYLSERLEGTVANYDDAPPRVLLSGAQGVGKTAALVGRNGEAGVLQGTHGLITLMLLPDHAKSDEALADYQANAPTGAPPAIVLKGRNRSDPAENDDSVQMCRAYETAKQLSGQGISIRSTLCKRCPFQETCGYLQQEAEIKRHLKSMTGLVIFAPHEFGYLPLPSEAKPDLVVFDERPRDFAVEDVHVTYQELMDYIIPQNGRHRPLGSSRALEIGESIFEQESAIQPIKQALLNAAGASAQVSLQALRDFGVSRDLLKQAIDGLERMRSENATREIYRSLGPGTQPATVNDLINLKTRLKNLPSNVANRLQVLFECLMAEIDSGREFAAAVFKRGPERKNANMDAGFSAVRIRKLKHGNSVPFLYLDGTADRELSQIAFGHDLECHHYPVERNAKVTQVIGCNFAKRRLCEDLQRCQYLTPKILAENKVLKGYVSEVLDRYPDAAVFASKAVIRSLSVSDASRLGHFGALRGQNKWEDRETVIVIGREQPAPQDIEIKARAYAAAANDNFLSGVFKKVPRGIRMPAEVRTIDVLAHQDKWGDKILRQIREVEIEQAIDRIRLIHNNVPKSVYLLSPTVINLNVDKIVHWRDFKKGGTRIEKAIRNHGVLFLSPSDCAKYMQDIWKSKQTAALDLSPAQLMSNDPCRYILHGEFDGKSPLRVEFLPEAGKGQRSRKKVALVFSGRSEAIGLVEALTGPLRKHRILQ